MKMSKDARMLGIGSRRATVMNRKEWEKFLRRATLFMSRRANDDDDDDDDDDDKTKYYF
jgi:hypothetical protein